VVGAHIAGAKGADPAVQAVKSLSTVPLPPIDSHPILKLYSRFGWASTRGRGLIFLIRKSRWISEHLFITNNTLNKFDNIRLVADFRPLSAAELLTLTVVPNAVDSGNGSQNPDALRIVDLQSDPLSKTGVHILKAGTADGKGDGDSRAAPDCADCGIFCRP